MPWRLASSAAGGPISLRRADEFKTAYLQTTARAAARAGDWAGVEWALRIGGARRCEHPRVAESVKGPRALAAQKDEVMFTKESAFAA